MDGRGTDMWRPEYKSLINTGLVLQAEMSTQRSFLPVKPGPYLLRICSGRETKSVPRPLPVQAGSAGRADMHLPAPFSVRLINPPEQNHFLEGEFVLKILLQLRNRHPHLLHGISVPHSNCLVCLGVKVICDCRREFRFHPDGGISCRYPLSSNSQL